LNLSRNSSGVLIDTSSSSSLLNTPNLNRSFDKAVNLLPLSLSSVASSSSSSSKPSLAFFKSSFGGST